MTDLRRTCMTTPGENEGGERRCGRMRFRLARAGNGSRLQEPEGPPPPDSTPCNLLPSPFPTRSPCRPLKPLPSYIRYGCISDGAASPIMPTSATTDLGERLFRVLLLLYPSAFRRRFADAMVAFFRDRRRERRHRGGPYAP